MKRQSSGQGFYCSNQSGRKKKLSEAAQDPGLGTYWVGAFSEAEVAEILMIPHHINPVCLLALGYPAETPPASARIDISRITHWESW